MTKRSTLSLEGLGTGNGRTCRTHEIVQDLVKVIEEKAEIKRKIDRLEEDERKRVLLCKIISDGADLVRNLLTTHNIPPEAVYERMRQKRVILKY